MSLATLPAELLLTIASYLIKPSDLLTLLLQNRYTYSVLHSTLYTNDINHHGCSALKWAARHNRVATAEHSLEHGADKVLSASYRKDKNVVRGEAFWASSNVKEESFGVAHVPGRNPDLYPYSDTPFSLAAKAGSVDVLRLLIRWNGGIVPQVLEREIVRGSQAGSSVPLLFLAAERGHLGVVRMLLEEFGVDKGVDVNVVDQTGKNCLGRVVLGTRLFRGEGRTEVGEGEREGERGEINNKWVAVSRLLLEHGANINHKAEKGRTPLALAAHSSAVPDACEPVARLLLENGADPSLQDTVERRTPLMHAVRKENEWLVRLLLEYASHCGGGRGIGLNKRDYKHMTPLNHAAVRGNEVIFRLLLEQEEVHPDAGDRHGHTPLASAVFRQHGNIVRMLLEHHRRVDVNRRTDVEQWTTPFIKSISIPHMDIFRLFLTLSDPNINALDSTGTPVLTLAMKTGYDVVVLELLEREGIIADQRDKKGMTPLMHAVMTGMYEIVEALVFRADVDINARDHAGRTPLFHVWSSPGSMKIARLLVDSGADVNARNYKDETPFVAAWRRRDFDLVVFLLEAGAKPTWVQEEIDDVGVFHPSKLFQLAMEDGHATSAEHALVMIANSGLPDPTISPDEHGRTPLCIAALRGQHRLVEVLLAHSRGEFERSAQPIALILAAMNGHDSVVRHFLSAESNGPDPSQGYMDLLEAMRHGYHEVVKMFNEVRHNSPPAYPSWLPLFVAALYGHEQVVKMFIASDSATEARKMVAAQSGNVTKIEDGNVPGGGSVDLTPLWLAAEHVWATGGGISSTKFVQYQLPHRLNSGGCESKEGRLGSPLELEGERIPRGEVQNVPDSDIISS
ncbi:hypothetical protein EMPG_17211 [Blastomyces silverae]|uniref:Uncharacterized protein n=1 Tax=Blastomyces silverae TaxID=2060906 RepID=A0A0H1B8C9_9EURO|nr:hypothetical protein EMPG_17211 [Blastomyces silverae]